MWKQFHLHDQPCPSTTTPSSSSSSNPAVTPHTTKSRCPACILLPCLDRLLKIASHPLLLQHNEHTSTAPSSSSAASAFLEAFPTSIIAQLGGTNRSHHLPTLYPLLSLSGKFQTLQNMLAYFVGQRMKVLVFSTSTEVLSLIEILCKVKGYTYQRLDGSTPYVQRQAMIDSYNKSNDGSKLVFLLSTRSGGLGINLTSATKVILYDLHWNPCMDIQAQDRAYRIGQSQIVHVYRLLSKGTIEEVIYMRQLYKQQLHRLVQQVDRKKVKRGRFEGIEGSKELHGELFGVHNLFQYNSGSHAAGLDDGQQGQQSIIAQLREKCQEKQYLRQKQEHQVAGARSCNNKTDVTSLLSAVPAAASAVAGDKLEVALEMLHSQEMRDAIDLLIEEDYDEAGHEIKNPLQHEKGLNYLHLLGIEQVASIPPLLTLWYDE